MIEWMETHPYACALVALLLAYTLLNVWKFHKPTSPAGRILLLLLMRIAIFSLKSWGLKDPRIPFSRVTEELERELEGFETKEKDP